MSQSHVVPIQRTQRAPRSCMSCSSRKVRCDKTVPQGTCIRRGRPEVCIREMVIVRGEVTTYRENPQLPTYDELRRDNERLLYEVEAIKAHHRGTTQSQQTSSITHDKKVSHSSHWSPRNRCLDEDADGLERKLWDSMSCNDPVAIPAMASWSDVILPSHSCSEKLIDYDEKWNSWVHYALEYPRFRYECDSFMSSIASGISLEQTDPFWLAVYFSVLSVCA
ncbi:hypothetical protein EK21DRAFT_94086 [Setomelanomma holmii]|uniref:Zn(2)-C6 fungal-type domain-containing protein n=1 Tax=Setomelanomma holmii TaxID=210430 RepID=A0A9P4H0F4_9PLEO|nr:hypothetical protein EK21DRAFT_94086 [Setomelanomma holmii]